MVPYVDIIRTQVLVLYGQNNIEFDPQKYCREIYQRILISVDGKAYPCCSAGGDSPDFHEKGTIGDISKATIKEIWHGKALNDIRAMQSNQDIQKRCQGFCHKCHQLQKLYDKEVVELHGRPVIIQGYY